MLTVRDVAAKLNFHPKTIREWCARGVFPGAAKWPNNGKTAQWRIPAEDVAALERARTSPSTPSNDRLQELMDAALASRTGDWDYPQASTPPGRRGS